MGKSLFSSGVSISPLKVIAASLLVTIACVADARPPFATTTDNSCEACHTSGPGRLTVHGDDMITLPGDPNGRGEIPIYLGIRPGDLVALEMQVDNGADRFAVQLKRFEKDEVYGGPPIPQDMARWAADNPDWTLQDEIWGPAGPTGTPWDTPYFTSVEFDGEVWADKPQPDRKTFNLHIAPETAPGFYDFEYAVAGVPGTWYGDQHFYIEVVPEPGWTFALAAAGAGLFTLHRRRQGSRSLRPGAST